MKTRILYAILLFWLVACIGEVNDLSLSRAPATQFSHKVISYNEHSLECRGYFSQDDVEGTLIETIPLGPTGQAPISICNESIAELERKIIYLK